MGKMSGHGPELGPKDRRTISGEKAPVFILHQLYLRYLPVYNPPHRMHGACAEALSLSIVRKSALFLLMSAAALPPAHAKFIPDPIVRYKIEARLDVKAKTVKGHEIIMWRNHTADSIPDLQFHTYLNAFKNNLSTFMREGGASSRRVSFRASPESWGYEQMESIKVNGQELTSKMRYIQPDDGNPDDQTVLQVPLPQPIGPQRSVTIEIQWRSKMPRVFARTGFHNNFFLVAQWFPKPGVYEAKGERHRAQGGWNCHQFHTSTEFFADYGTFDVDLTLPSNFELGATGAERSRKDNGDGTTTYNHYQEDVHDFAWTAEPKSDAMQVVRMFKADEQVSPAEIAEWSQKTGTRPEDVRLQDVKVTLFIQREHGSQIDRHFRAIFNAIKWFGLFYGKYPYDVLTVVDPPPFAGAGAGGMEYPTFITAGTSFWPAARALSPEGVIVHEFGHQFWYGLVGNNEFEEAWLDEGFNSYSTGKVLDRAYGPDYGYERLFGVPIPARPWLNIPVPRYPWNGLGNIAIGPYWEWVPIYEDVGRSRSYWDNAQSDAMERYAWQTLNRASYGDQAYSKPELTLLTLEGLLGDVWPRVIRTYHQRWRFKHPDAINFIDTVKEVSGRDMKWFFEQTVYGTSVLNYSVSFTTGKQRARRGFFDQEGGPKFNRGPKKEEEDNDEQGPYESEVLVRRLGEMRFPVSVLVKFADGSSVRESWGLHSNAPPQAASAISDDQYRWVKFKYFNRPKIVSAQVDPDFIWELEVPRSDDSYLRDPVTLAADKWYLRWVVWIQNVTMAFSFFS